MKGVYEHCGRQHLHRYVADFEFRYNHRTANDWTDTERAAEILKAAEGRRLTYRRTDTRASVEQRWSRKKFQRLLRSIFRSLSSNSD